MTSARARGFSLLELVVSLFVVALVLVLSVRLLRQSQGILLDWQRLAPQPIASIGESLVRADIQAASRLEIDPGCNFVLGTWTRCPLGLGYMDGGAVRYETTLRHLVRSNQNADGSANGSRTVLKGVSHFRWRMLEGGVVEIDLAYTRSRDPGIRFVASRRGMDDRPRRTETIRARYAMRNRGSRTWW